MSGSSSYHPVYNPTEFGKFATKIRHFEEAGDKIARYSFESRAKAQRKHERLLDKEFGSVSSEDFHHRMALVGMAQTFHSAWRWDGMLVTDVSDGLIVLQDVAVTEALISPAFGKLPAMYIHFGEASPARLSSFTGVIEGVYVRPPQLEDESLATLKNALGGMISFQGGLEELGGEFTFAVICSRGGRQLPNASLEALILNQSSVVFSKFHHDHFDLIDGATDMVGETAVDLANRMAFHAYCVSVGNSQKKTRAVG